MFYYFPNGTFKYNVYINWLRENVVENDKVLFIIYFIRIFTTLVRCWKNNVNTIGISDASGWSCCQEHFVCLKKITSIQLKLEIKRVSITIISYFSQI